LHQVALSISFLSPIFRRPAAFDATKIASLIFRPECRFLALTSFHSRRRPSLRLGSSSSISLCRQSLALSLGRFLPPGNIQSPSRLRLTSSTRPRFEATYQFRRFRHSLIHHLSNHPLSLFLNPVQNCNERRISWQPLLIAKPGLPSRTTYSQCRKDSRLQIFELLPGGWDASYQRLRNLPRRHRGRSPPQQVHRAPKQRPLGYFSSSGCTHL
jgi:hypothetical protein